DELVELVEVDVREHRASDPALRSPAECGSVVPSLEIPGLEEALHQGQEAAVADLFAEDRQQGLVANIVEAPFDITLDEPLRTCPEAEEVTECRVTPAPRSEAVGSVAELRLVIRVQNGPHHLLQQFVRPTGDAQRA